MLTTKIKIYILRIIKKFKNKITCTICILTIKKKNDQMPLFFLPWRKMNEITYVKKTRDET